MALFEEGKQFPNEDSIKRMARYQEGEIIFNGVNDELQDVYRRARELLKNTPHEKQLRTLYTAVNLAELLCTKPADLIVGEPCIVETPYPDDNPVQVKVTDIAERNHLTPLLHASTIGNGFRGDAFFKVRYDFRQDFSELLAFGGKIPDSEKMESIIESVNPNYVFPEESDRNIKQFKAVNVAFVQYEDGFGNVYNPLEDEPKDELERVGRTAYLYVERHIPGYIFHQKFRLHPKDHKRVYGVDIPIYTIGESVRTGREKLGLRDIEETGVPFPLVFHAPYKAIDTKWEGISFIEMVKDILSDINDRITQISYILWKHADPTAFGPDLSGVDNHAMKWGGKYIPLDKDDPEPGYMVWEAQLDSAFRELDNSLGVLFMMAETPQWLFGTVLTNDKAGTGTSHTDGSAIKARFMPIVTKVNRIRLHLDKAIRDAIYAAQLLEIQANKNNPNFEKYEAVRPTITWKDGIPRDDKELAEIMAIRTGNKPTIDVQNAIKMLDEVNDITAKEVMDRIKDDKKEAMEEMATPSIFNEVQPPKEPKPKKSDE